MPEGWGASGLWTTACELKPTACGGLLAPCNYNTASPQWTPGPIFVCQVYIPGSYSRGSCNFNEGLCVRSDVGFLLGWTPRGSWFPAIVSWLDFVRLPLGT